MPSDPITPCHLCGAQLDPIEAFAALRRVTSDCRPWPVGGQLAVCRRCDTVQKLTDHAWRKECQDIYASYAIYQQAAGAEQLVFGPGGAAAPRSRRLVEQLSTRWPLPQAGRLLDIGCGNGAFLAAFGAARPAWRLTGVEVGDTNRAAVEALPGIERFHVGEIDELTGPFDAIVMVHCLEHIPDPVGFLRKASDLLTKDGVMLVQVPNFRDNAFDLLIADHCTHFSPATLGSVAAAAGLAVNVLSSEWVPKEISLLAHARAGGEEARAVDGNFAAARAQIDWLARMIQEARQQPAPIGIFGTSIAGSWAAATLEGSAAFFLDEDPNRVHRAYMGLPVLIPSEPLPAHSRIILPMPPMIAANIAARLPALDFLMPPA